VHNLLLACCGARVLLYFSKQNTIAILIALSPLRTSVWLLWLSSEVSCQFFHGNCMFWNWHFKEWSYTGNKQLFPQFTAGIVNRHHTGSLPLAIFSKFSEEKIPPHHRTHQRGNSHYVSSFSNEAEMDYFFCSFCVCYHLLQYFSRERVK